MVFMFCCTKNPVEEANGSAVGTRDTLYMTYTGNIMRYDSSGVIDSTDLTDAARLLIDTLECDTAIIIEDTLLRSMHRGTKDYYEVYKITEATDSLRLLLVGVLLADSIHTDPNPGAPFYAKGSLKSFEIKYLKYWHYWVKNGSYDTKSGLSARINLNIDSLITYITGPEDSFTVFTYYLKYE
jgi:hypothetical protein